MERRLPDLSLLESRLAEMGPRLQALEAHAGRAGPELDGLRAGLERRIDELRALAGGGDVGPHLDEMRQTLLTRLDEQSRGVDDRLAELNARVDGLAGEVSRLAAELGDARSVVTDRIGPLEAAVKSALEQTPPEGQDTRAADESAALRTELADLREQLSEANLRRLLADTVPAAPEPGPAAVESSGLAAEVARLGDRLKRQASLTLVGGAVLLGVVGLLLVFG